MAEFRPDLGRADRWDRGMLSGFLAETAASTAAASFVGELAEAVRGEAPVVLSVDLDAAGRAAASEALAAAYDVARADGVAVTSLVLRLMCEWERFSD